MIWPCEPRTMGCLRATVRARPLAAREPRYAGRRPPFPNGLVVQSQKVAPVWQFSDSLSPNQSRDAALR